MRFYVCFKVKLNHRKILDIAQMGLTGHTVSLKDALKEAYDRIDSRSSRDCGARLADSSAAGGSARSWPAK